MEDRKLHIYLDAATRQSVAAGQRRMLTEVKLAVEEAGWEVVLLPEAARDVAAQLPGHHLVVNREVPAPGSLVLRRCYFDPFWRIETTNDRWDWQIAGQTFPGTPLTAQRAGQFMGYWRKQLFGTQGMARDGYVFVPLQGKLTRQRSFQSLSPVAMLEALLHRWPGVPVKATLHPRETYEAEELAALAALADRYPAFSMPEADSVELLMRCNLVATQNSGMALKGFFAEKPALLFGRIDFHHIAASVPHLGLEGAFAQVEQGGVPPFADYLHWFLKDNALNFWGGNLRDTIRGRLRQHGWPV